MENYKKIFRDFTSPYLQNASAEEKGDFELKFQHSFDVYENCRAICESLPLERVRAETVMVAALFHDTGRFPQYREYGTFKDADSCNHAIMGVRYILREKLLDSLPAEKLRIVLGAIALHNRSSIPDNLSSEIRTAVEIVRDSDKIDIIKVLLARMENITPESRVALMGLPDLPQQVSEPVLRSVENRTQADYTKMKCINDFRLLILSWVYDLNFKWSRREMIRRGYVERIFSNLPEYERITALYEPVMEQLNS